LAYERQATPKIKLMTSSDIFLSPMSIRAALALNDLDFTCNVCGQIHTLFREADLNRRLSHCLLNRLEEGASCLPVTLIDMVSLRKTAAACNRAARRLCYLNMLPCFREIFDTDTIHACTNIAGKTDMLMRYAEFPGEGEQYCRSIITNPQISLHWILALSALEANRIIGVTYLHAMLTASVLWELLAVCAGVIQKAMLMPHSFFLSPEVLLSRMFRKLMFAYDELIACKQYCFGQIQDNVLSLLCCSPYSTYCGSCLLRQDNGPFFFPWVRTVSI